MTTTIEQAKEHAEDLVMNSADLKTMQDEMDAMILMDWTNNKPVRAGQQDSLRFTTSPEARNAYLGALRILSSTEPIISVPRNNNDSKLNSVADQIEKICKGIWYQSGRLAQRPVHYDLLNSLLRYDEYHLAIKNTQDMLDQCKDTAASPAEKHRLEKLAASTPYIFEAMDVKNGYWERDPLGLTCYYRKTSLTYAQAVNLFGEKALEKSHISPTTRQSDIIYHHDYWDLTVHYSWLDLYGEVTPTDHLLVGADDHGRHNLPYIPIVCQVAEASTLETDHKYQRQPLLYGAWKGSLWERMNLLYTIIYSNLFAVASNPMYIHEQSVPGSTVEIDYTVVGGMTNVPPGDRLTPMQRDVINQDIEKALMLAENKFSESTIYKQTLGGPSSSENSSFSMTSLLAQTGRLPLTNYQRCGGWGIGTAFEIMFDLMKDNGKTRTLSYLQGKLDIDPKMIPDDLIIDVKLDADLPQDKLQQANVGSMLKQNQLASDSWIRENILNIGQSQDMTREIQEEMFVAKMFEEGLYNEMRKEIAAEEQQKAQQQAQQAIQQFMQQNQARQRQPLPPELNAQSLAQRGGPPRPRPRMPIDQSRNAGMGGMPPSATGLIPAQGPGQQPVPAENFEPGVQEGEEVMM
ncbi:MAG TPA: hypothetical protein PL124_12215 [Candidatus Cloacimonadota bacterium]|nr:hypothetical protein [Candidatus Cloacimonadota bacterium]